MNKTLMLLIQLQNLIIGGDDYRRVEGRIGCLRAYIPEDCLNRFDQLLNRRRMAVAALTDTGACGGCCIRLSATNSTVIQRQRSRVHTCQFCGCFLYAPVAGQKTT